MKFHANSLLSALAAAGITVALAQAPAQPAPAAAPPLPPNLVAEPTASLSRADGPGADVGKQLVDTINADQSLKGAKITVQPEDGKITLTGVTQTRAQAKQLAQMAAQAVGVENVTNAIRESEAIVERDPAPQAQPGAEQGQAQPADPANPDPEAPASPQQAR